MKNNYTRGKSEFSIFQVLYRTYNVLKCRFEVLKMFERVEVVVCQKEGGGGGVVTEIQRVTRLSDAHKL